tara:strand:+ start:420 stop:665 length:246 start_codon:yes stop_codon:yes gene_type:complete
MTTTAQMKMEKIKMLQSKEAGRKHSCSRKSLLMLSRKLLKLINGLMVMLKRRRNRRKKKIKISRNLIMKKTKLIQKIIAEE